MFFILREPDFSLLKKKTSVLAKDNDNIWKRATITALILENNQCCVRFDSGHKKDVIIDIHNTLPLEKSDEGWFLFFLNILIFMDFAATQPKHFFCMIIA